MEDYIKSTYTFTTRNYIDIIYASNCFKIKI